jgi:hypothetical protein
VAVPGSVACAPGPVIWTACRPGLVSAIGSASPGGAVTLGASVHRQLAAVVQHPVLAAGLPPPVTPITAVTAGPGTPARPDRVDVAFTRL